LTAAVPEKLTLSSGPINLYVERWGEGEPSIVFCHGFGGSARNFRPQARAFAASCRAITFDARGHARSDAPVEPDAYEPDRFVEDVSNVLDVIGIERALIVGLSMGAGIALRFAATRPERVLGLLVAAYPRPASTPGHAAWALGFADAIEAEGVEAAGARFAWGERFQRDPKGAELIRIGFLEHQPHALVNVLRRVLAVQPAPADQAPRLAGLTGPISIVVGGQDAGSLAPSRELSALLPAAQLVEIEGGGHVVNLTNPAEFNRALRDLLARL
jgi:pimeloyl-ACP methyl ester carboxylesterase